MNLEEETKLKIISLLTVLFPDAKIYLYGSRARGDHQESSDIDLAIDSHTKLSFTKLGEARSILEASQIPHRVDIVDYNSASERLRPLIDQDKIVWKN